LKRYGRIFTIVLLAMWMVISGMPAAGAENVTDIVIAANDTIAANQTAASQTPDDGQPQTGNESVRLETQGTDLTIIVNSTDQTLPEIPTGSPDNLPVFTEPDPMYTYFPDLLPGDGKTGDAVSGRLDENPMQIRTDSSGSSIRWQRAYGGTGSEDDITGYARPTPDGGYIASVTTFSDDGDLTGKSLHGGPCIWVVKLDSSGTIQWQTAPLFSRARDVRQVNDGGYVAVGFRDNNSGSGEDIWVVKLDRSGNVQWTCSWGFFYLTRPSSILQTADGGYVILGYSRDVSGQGWIAKVSRSGTFEWQRYYGGSSNDYTDNFFMTRDGGYIVSGSSESNNACSNGNHGGADAWVLKLDQYGNVLWQKCFGGSANDYAKHIEQTPDGAYIVAGITASNDGDVSGLHNEVGGSDAWVFRLDSSGSIVWQRTLGGTRGDYAVDVKQTPDGGYVVAAGTESNDMDVSGNHGGRDVWVVKLDSTGTPLWQLCLGGSDWENPGSILLTGDGEYVTASATLSNNGDVSGNHGNYDLWIVKHGEGMPINPPELIVDATDLASSTLIPGATIGLFDPAHDEWLNVTAGTGSYTFTSSGSSQQYALVTGTEYQLAASADGYSPAVRDVMFTQDGQRETMELSKLEPEVFTYSMTNTISKYDQPPHFIRSGAELENVSEWLSKDATWKLVFSKSDTEVDKNDFGILESGLNNATLHWHTGHGGYDELHPDESGLAIINTDKLEECKINQSKDCTIIINGHSICENKRTTCSISEYSDILTPQEIAGKWNKNNKWVVLSSCQVMQDDRWNNALGTTHGIFGFSTDSIADPSLSYQFFKFAMEDRLPLAEAWRNATIDVYDGKTVSVPLIPPPDGYSYYPVEVPITATVRFANESQYYNDHLPGYGTVEPDTDPDVIFVKSWDCVKEVY
jgi:hypothetical protein